MELVKWDEMKHQIEQSNDIQELSGLADKLEGIRVMARQSKQSLEVQNSIAEYRLRVERKRGEWLKDNKNEMDKGGNPNLSTASTGWKLQDVGMSRDESSKAQRIANLKPKQFEEYIQETKNTNQEVTLAGAVKLAKQIIREDKIEEQINTLQTQPPIKPKGEYDVIVIDPPWNYGTKYDPIGRRVANPYPEMNQEQLLNIQLPSKKDCVLWLWTTNGFIRDTYELLEEWGFAPKTILTWNKVNTGTGHWLRGVTEHCILAVKGSPVWTNKTHTTLITEKRTEHSTKPDGFYKMVDEICYGRKLDYFARKKRDGWDTYGDEVQQ